MADDIDMDSDACNVFERRMTYTPSSLQQKDFEDSSSPIQASKKSDDLLGFNAKLTQRNEELGFAENQESEKVEDFGALVEEEGQIEKDSMELEVGLSGIQESIVEGEIKESMAAKTLMVAENKRLLATVDKVLNDSEEIDAVKSVDGDLRCPVKIELIDDTALIESVRAPRIGNGCLKDMGKAGTAKGMDRNQKKQQVDGKKAKRSKKKSKNTKIVSGMISGIIQDEVGGLNNGDGVKIMYSREEMKALRFVNIGQQRKTWTDIYTGLGPSVANEYDNLVGLKNLKQIPKSSESRICFSNKIEAPGILGNEFSEKMENEAECTEDYAVEGMNTINPSSRPEVKICSVLEGEGSEYYDTDEECASIQRPAFLVEGEPNFESGPPEDGLEYLRRVRWEVSHIAKVKVAKSGQKINKEQTVYMPQIPDIAQCPEQFLPLKQWEDQFVADFSKLREVLSGLVNLSAQRTSELLQAVPVHRNDSHHSPEIFTEYFNDLRTSEVSSDRPLDGFCIKSSMELPFISDTIDDQYSPHKNLKSSTSDDSGDYPTLSAILRVDSVARVSALRKHINSVESLSNLSRTDCLWLFALCAAVDTPLDADTCAALRGLLRKCAGLRAGKSELDDEVIMLNILATISGKYFGQSER